ncbi:amino acid ABC transporter substrate-binding protein [Christiangramia aquimixticola]|uniref:amino acid ABC transporter substrate-binding protein n=1 Tax=Christiangramia aquimixticola TaxID=1697558 RepID=UPI003AA90C2F
MKYLFVICFLFLSLTSAVNAQSFKYHTVKKGETVFSISQSYSIDEEDIYKYNPDARQGIGINEKLVIPIENNATSSNTSVQFKEHKVKKKETLYSLSREYNVSVDDIKRYNKHLYSSELQMGEVLQIPVGQIPSTVLPKKETTVAPKPSAVSQNFKTREHIVLPKETKYGIARKYGMTLTELNELNPKVEVLQPGMMIRVGTNVLEDEPVIITDDRFRFYEVKPQETLYSLSQRFGVSQDSLRRLNPALDEGLKFGMVLKVPAREGEDIENDSDFEVQPGTANTLVDLSTSLSNRSKTKEIVLLLPYHLNMVQEDSLQTYRKAIMDERVLRISLDFYSGVLMAVEKAKKLGISTNLRVFDTKREASEIQSIIYSNNFDNVDAVIGPLMKDVTETTASLLQNKNVPVINPLSNREMKGYTNLVQSRPNEEYMQEKMVDYIARNASGKNVIVVADGKSYTIKNKIMNAIPSARAANPSDNYIAESKLAEMLKPGENWVILESESINLVSSVTAALNRLARAHNIKLFTTNKNNSYESDIVSNNHLGKLQMHYPSVDKEYDTAKTKDFIEDYEKKYKIQPNQYAIRGYDLTLDVLLRLASSQNLYESFEKFPGYTEYYESKFHYMPKPNGGYLNDAIYILKLNEDLTISEANDL